MPLIRCSIILGELVGVYRLAAKASKPLSSLTYQKFNLLLFSIPANTQIESKDGKVIFKTLKDSLIQSGLLYVETEVEAETEGLIGNGYLAGEIKNLITLFHT